jgi:glutamate-1-semialdehyde 2,1-aminomutase
MAGLFFTPSHVTDFDTAKSCDTALYGRYFHAMLRHGVYLAPSQFEAYFFSTAHGERELEQTLSAQRAALEEVHG